MASDGLLAYSSTVRVRVSFHFISFRFLFFFVFFCFCLRAEYVPGKFLASVPLVSLDVSSDESVSCLPSYCDEQSRLHKAIFYIAIAVSQGAGGKRGGGGKDGSKAQAGVLWLEEGASKRTTGNLDGAGVVSGVGEGVVARVHKVPAARLRWREGRAGA